TSGPSKSTTGLFPGNGAQPTAQQGSAAAHTLGSHAHAIGRHLSMFAKRLCCAGLALFASSTPVRAAASAPDATDQARLFLLRYAELTATSDVAALDMYRDDAQISVSARRTGEE